MTEPQKTVLSLLSKALFANPVAISATTDWNSVLREAQLQAVPLLVYSAADGVLPATEREVWEKQVLPVMANNAGVIYDHELLNKWLSEAKVPYVVLKGCSSAFYYPDPSCRSMGDVDFFVPEGFVEIAGKVLEEHGLEPWSESHISHIVYRQKGKHYELHHQIAGMPEGDSGQLIRQYLKDVFEKAAPQKIGDSCAVLPSPFHHGLIILLHICHHLTGEGIGLRHLCDWAVFENSFSADAFRGLFEEKLKAVGLWRFAQVLTCACVKYLGAQDREWVDCDDDLADRLMEDILASGNFGQKDGSRNMQTLLISDRGKNGVGRVGMPAQFVRSVNDVIRQKWPKSKSNKLLIPVGWVYFGGKRLFREIIGRREKTNVRRVIGGASERRALYQRLRLYEREHE